MSYEALIANMFQGTGVLRTVKFIRDAAEYNLKVVTYKMAGEESAMVEQDIYVLTRHFALSKLNNPDTLFAFPPTTDDQIDDADLGRMGITKVDPVVIGPELLFWKLEAQG